VHVAARALLTATGGSPELNRYLEKLELARPYERAPKSLMSGRRLSPLGCPARGLPYRWTTARCRAGLLARGLLDTIHQVLGQVRGAFLRLVHDVLCLTSEGAIRHERIETSASRRKQEPARRYPSSSNPLPLSRVSDGG